ncbi:hypothetical protein I4F81_008572 [Pyropia yezoensis]|uniref:Uncharacterized protein n=1 Tax=Pyropia yezoensis TaxID=2788 RepID=A0ACC3C8C7_PYRYE|nr:hypothetical protein I4F81_008572 [Neopyropia yezoensis]
MDSWWFPVYQTMDARNIVLGAVALIDRIVPRGVVTGFRPDALLPSVGVDEFSPTPFKDAMQDVMRAAGQPPTAAHRASIEEKFGGSEAQGDGEDGSADPAEAGADGGSSRRDDELFWAAWDRDYGPEAAAAAERAKEQERQAAEAAAAEAAAAAAAERVKEQERQAAEAAASEAAAAAAAERVKEQERQAAEAAASEAAAAAAAERVKEQERQAAEAAALELKKQAVADTKQEADVVQAAARAVVQREEHALNALRSKLSKTTADLAEASHTLAVVQQDSDEAGDKLRTAYRAATTAYTAVKAASVKLDAARASTERCVEDAQKASVVESAVVSRLDSLAAAADSAIDDLRTHCGEDEHCAALIAQLDLIPRVRHGQPVYDRARIARRAAETAGTPVGKVDEGTRKAV